MSALLYDVAICKQFSRMPSSRGINWDIKPNSDTVLKIFDISFCFSKVPNLVSESDTEVLPNWNTHSVCCKQQRNCICGYPLIMVHFN